MTATQGMVNSRSN